MYNQKTTRELEKNLFKSFINENDSEKRKRYIKNWLYGNNIITRNIPKEKEEEKEIKVYKKNFWKLVHTIITGDEE